MTVPDQTIAQMLAATAITPGLDSVLVFDAPPARQRAIEAALVALLDTATGETVRVTRVGSTATEDALWGSYVIADGAVRWNPGALVSGEPTLAVVRDLATLGLEAQRALVALVSADVAHLERHGWSQQWTPRTIWLAHCARADVGRISPHLLDRFAVRIDGVAPVPKRTTESVRKLIGLAEKVVRLVDDETVDAPLPNVSSVTAKLRRRTVETTPAAIERVLDYFPEDAPSRRPIVLARLATGLAKLAHAGEVSANHVDSAAALLGVALVAPTKTPAEPPTTPRPDPGHSQDHGTFVNPDPDPNLVPTNPVVIPDPIPPHPVEPQSTNPTPTIVGVPFQEDRAEVDRDLAPLAFPIIVQRASLRATRGSAIGVMRTTEFRDLALTATVLESAKHRVARSIPDGRVEVTAADLLRYRRVAPVEHMLALVVDHTALGGWEWFAAVAPHLYLAYTQRASICLVQVGAEPEPLRARQSVSRSVRSAPLEDMIDAVPGRATPLAHGLELAFEALRHALQHGRGVALRGTLVVVTDGRGNVPLDASRRGELVGKIRDQGFQDTIKIAEKIRSLDRLDSFLIEPPPTVGRELTIQLARAMGAQRQVAQRAEGAG